MRSTLILALLSCCIVLVPCQSSLAQDKRISKPASVAAETTDKELDGLFGPVRRVRVEIAKISVKDGNFTEGPRILRETTTYDPKGRKIDTVAHPVEGSTLPGKEEYRYDDNGNIVEMTLRANDGSILSKETYKYELDEMGNWKKMTSSVAIYENGKVIYEPIEVTYRTISYYFSQAVDKLVASNSKPDARGATNTVAETAATTPAVVITTPAKTSEEKPAPTIEKRVEPSIGNKAAEMSPASKSVATPLEKAAVPKSTEVGATNSSGQPKVTEKVDGATSEKVGANAETSAGGDSASSQPTTPAKSVDAPTEKVTKNNEAPATVPDSAFKPTSSAITERAAPEKTTTLTEKTTAPTATTTTGKTSVPTASETTTPADPATPAYEKGLGHLAALRYADAVKSFNESVRLNPNDAQSYVKLGVAYSSQGLYKEAVAVLKMAIQIKREAVDAQGYYHLATGYAALGKHSNALDAFKQALYILRAESVDHSQTKTQNAPPLAHVYHGIGAMYYNLQRHNDAIKELKRAIELNPKLADAYYVLALSYLELGNRKSAESHRDTLKSLNSKLAGKIDAALSKQGSGVHCRTVFGPCQ
jgi:Flp pilus assembly protein TadD